MEELLIPPDIHEQILERLDVKTLIICKCVCKSWHSLISNPRFVKAQLNISCNNDCTNNAIGRHRRIVLNRTLTPYINYYGGGVDRFYYLVGSCNGLVCISKTSNVVLVANPSTREVKSLKSSKFPWVFIPTQLFWGFGYDSSTDDYKVIVGHLESSSHQICFQMLTLKSNVWIHIGKAVNCKYIVDSIGTLCSGKLHWFVRYQDELWGTLGRSGILSFDLSTQTFKEIPEPHDFKYTSDGYRLGVIKECLCIFDNGYGVRPPSKIWVMNNDDVKQPNWKLMTAYDYAIEDQVVHVLDCLPNKISTDTDDVFLSNYGSYFNSPLFVPSLVSPYADGRPKRKRQTENTVRSLKLTKGVHSVPRLSARD